MWLAPARSSLAEVRGKDLGGSMEDWEWFVQDTRQSYNVDMSVLSQSYQEEQNRVLPAGTRRALTAPSEGTARHLLRSLTSPSQTVRSLFSVLS